MGEENRDLFFSSLLISLMALNMTNEIFYQRAKVPKKITDICKISLYSNVILESKNIFFTMNVRKISRELLEVLDNKNFYNLNKNRNLLTKRNEDLEQYLRKFSFLYQSILLKTYPNKLSSVACKRINIIAIKNLYHLNNL